MMGTMVECAHFGPASCWMVSPVVGNPPKILSAGGGWGRINPPPVADPLLPLPDIPPLGLQFSHTPNFAPNFSIFISHLLSNFTISHHPISIIICHGKMPFLLGYK